MSGPKASSNHLGEFIKAQRTLAKLSQRELARMSEVSDAYVSQLERGMHQPTVKVLRSLASALDIRSDTMLRYAGWLDNSKPADDDDVERAIRADSRLTQGQKEALLSVYRSFLNEAACE